MTRCKHPNVIIIEHGESHTFHQRECPGQWDHDSDFDSYSGAVSVECKDCGMYKKYNPSNYPKWLQEALSEIFMDYERIGLGMNTLGRILMDIRDEMLVP